LPLTLYENGFFTSQNLGVVIGLKCCSDNCCHWWSFVNDENSLSTKQNFVLSFDMVNEVFRKIKVAEGKIV
jgi:hypothetical protein